MKYQRLTAKQAVRLLMEGKRLTYCVDFHNGFYSGTDKAVFEPTTKQLPEDHIKFVMRTTGNTRGSVVRRGWLIEEA